MPNKKIYILVSYADVMIEKLVTKFGKRSAHVILPNSFIGKPVYIYTSPLPDSACELTFARSDSNTSATSDVLPEPSFVPEPEFKPAPEPEPVPVAEPEHIPEPKTEPTPELDPLFDSDSGLDEAEEDFVLAMNEANSFLRLDLLRKGELQFGKNRLAYLVSVAEERKIMKAKDS